LNAERTAPPIRHLLLLVLIIGIAGLAAVGCAKRPAVATASAPAPTAVAPTPPPPAPAPVAPTPAPEPTPPPAAAAPPPPAPAAAPAPPPAPKEFATVPQVKEIYFDFDKYDIRPGDAQILRSNAQWLKDNANQLILIEGHCDERGTNEYNMALGERRAKATMNFLVAQGIKADRISIISYGEERPGCTEHKESCWAQNRRARTLVKPQ
jgi:peptidoglycan-associated lipoprotein